MRAKKPVVKLDVIEIIDEEDNVVDVVDEESLSDVEWEPLIPESVRKIAGATAKSKCRPKSFGGYNIKVKTFMKKKWGGIKPSTKRWTWALDDDEGFSCEA